MTDNNATISAIEAILKLNLSSTKKVEMIQDIIGERNQEALPQNYRTKLCRYFAAGHCEKGDKCTYIHPPTKIKRRQNYQTTETDPESWSKLQLIDGVVKRDDGLWITGLTDRKFPKEMRLLSFMTQEKRIMRSKKGFVDEKKLLEQCQTMLGTQTVTVTNAEAL